MALCPAVVFIGMTLSVSLPYNYTIKAGHREKVTRDRFEKQFTEYSAQCTAKTKEQIIMVQAFVRQSDFWFLTSGSKKTGALLATCFRMLLFLIRELCTPL